MESRVIVTRDFSLYVAHKTRGLFFNYNYTPRYVKMLPELGSSVHLMIFKATGKLLAKFAIAFKKTRC